jgi:hypothetical protein
MSNSGDLVERARMFERRAELAKDPISKQHYREMASHFRMLAVEHLNSKSEQELS